jgi:hypothetical protein
MNTNKLYYFLALFFILPAFMVQNSGCHKEYSFEGIDTARIVRDTIVVAAPLPVVKEFPDCSLCNPAENLSLGHWNFVAGNSFLCGGVTNSGFIGGFSKTDFTLFGASACSIDTGLVISAYLPVPLDQDRFNVTTDRAAMYYYDNNAPKDILISYPPEPFSVTVQSFIFATGIVTGTFKGIVFKANGDTASVTGGKFHVILK